MCEKSGEQISPETVETLFRHVNPSWLDNGQPSSQAFYPFGEKDDGCLSVDRGSLTCAAAAYCALHGSATCRIRLTSCWNVGFVH